MTEFTLAMMTACLAKVFESVERVKDGTQWIQTPRRSLSSLNIGFVGMGGIGSEMAIQLHRRGCRSLRYWSRSRKVELETSLGLRYESLTHMVNSVDVLCIHLTGCDDTYHLIDEQVLNRASAELMIFNMSSPSIVCPAALKKFLSSNPQAFCLIDGYYDEWIYNKGQHNDEHGLLSLPSSSLIVTSHLAAQEKETINEMFARALKQIFELAGDRRE
ncbi:D-lactate dehydrogenase [compost metagenome]